MDEWYDDITITCSNCGREYTWRGGRIKYMSGEVPDVCKTCYENPHLHPIALICQNKSCEKAFEWSVGEQAFYQKKGFDQPALCTECREEKKNQRNVTIYCNACNERRTIKKQYIISYRRETGQWSPPQLCKLCEDDPDRVVSEVERKLAREYTALLRSQRRNDYYQRQRNLGSTLQSYGPRFSRYFDPDTLSVVSNPQSFDILDDAETYEQIEDHKYGNVLAHITKPQHESLKKLGTNEGQRLIFMSHQIARETNKQLVTQFKDTKTGYWIKRDNITGQVAIIRQYESPPPPFRLVTTYQVDESQVVSKITGRAWKPEI